MSGKRTKTAWLCAAAAFALCLIALSAHAADRDRPSAPTPLVAPAPERQAPKPATPSGIEEAPLSPLDLSWANALPGGETPLPPRLWQGTSRTMLRAMLAELTPTDSPTLHAVTRRLLLSGAAAPPGNDPADSPLLLLRAERLYALGMLKGAIAVLELLPPEKRSEAMARLRIELAFAEHDIDGACRAVGVGVLRYREIWWDRARIACQLLQGKHDEAALALEVLRDRNPPPDPEFDALIAIAEGHPVKLPRAARLSPLKAALFALGKRPLPEAQLATADPATLAAFAGSIAEPVENRLAAAERAGAFGAWSPDQLAQLYRAVNSTKEERARPPEGRTLGDTPRGRALLFTAAAAANDPLKRASLLRRFLEAAGRHGLTGPGAALAAPLIAAIPPRTDTKPFAASFARALLAIGKIEAAAPWLRLADGDAIRPLKTLIAAIAGGRATPSPAAIASAIAAMAARRGTGARRAEEMFLMLAAAFGAQLTPDELAAGLAPPHRAALPSLGLWLAQRDAAVAHRLGETLLASLVIATSEERLTLEPVVLARALAGLRAGGMEGDAQRIALEAAIGAGL